MKELSQNLGSAFGRLINETMIPVVTKILEVMDERGLIDLPLRVNGLEVKVSPTSPLANAQAMDEVNAALQFAQLTREMGAEGQVAVKFGEMIDYLGDKLGVPAALRNSAAERVFAIEQQQAQDAQAMAAQMAMQQQGMAPPGQPTLPAPQGAM
jgi:hypothetical protein